MALDHPELPLTCPQRGLSPWHYIAEAQRERRPANPAPALPVTAAA